METVTLVAPDISCSHCQSAIERALNNLDGVRSVSVNIDTKHVDVGYDASRTSRQAIVAILDEEGYPISE